MTTVGKVVLGMMGRLRPKPASGDNASTIALPQVDPHGGMPLMEALAARRSSREFAPDSLPVPVLAGLLWAAYGINRPDGGRTAPTAINAQEIDVFAALPTGAYLYDAAKSILTLVAATDVRRSSSIQATRMVTPARSERFINLGSCDRGRRVPAVPHRLSNVSQQALSELAGTAAGSGCSCLRLRAARIPPGT